LSFLEAKDKVPRPSGFNYHSHNRLGFRMSIKLLDMSVSSSCRRLFTKG
jgi:hypothetical protein